MTVRGLKGLSFLVACVVVLSNHASEHGESMMLDRE